MYPTYFPRNFPVLAGTQLDEPHLPASAVSSKLKERLCSYRDEVLGAYEATLQARHHMALLKQFHANRVVPNGMVHEEMDPSPKFGLRIDGTEGSNGEAVPRDAHWEEEALRHEWLTL